MNNSTTHHWKSKIENGFFEIYDTSDNNHVVYATPIIEGMKVKMCEADYNKLINDEKIQQKFELKVKRLNRWYWSVYFERKVVK